MEIILEIIEKLLKGVVSMGLQKAEQEKENIKFKCYRVGKMVRIDIEHLENLETEIKDN